MAQPNKELKNTGYEIFIGILSILSIVILIFSMPSSRIRLCSTSCIS